MKYLVILCAILVPLVSVAENPESNDVLSLNRNGKDYVCFTTTIAQELLQLKLYNPILELKIKALNDRISVKEKIIDEMGSVSKNMQEQVKISYEIIGKQDKQILENRKWYNSKTLWFIVGAAVGVAVPVSVLVLR